MFAGMKSRRFRALTMLSLAAGLCFSSLSGRSQSYQADFNLHLKEQKVYLASFYGEKIIRIDSGVTDARGHISFRFPPSRKPGLYRVFTGRQHFLDFIFNREEIALDMDLSSPGNPPVVIRSKENAVFYRFLIADQLYRQKAGLLEIFGREYPVKDRFYRHAAREHRQATQSRNAELERLIRQNEGTWAARALALYREPVLGWDLTEQERKRQRRERFFERISLCDSLLTRSNLLTTKVIEYLSLWPGPEMGPSEAEAAFIKGVDVVLGNAETDQTVYEFLVSYLVGGFEKYKMEKVLTHLYEKYLTGSHCPGEVRQDELARRLKAYEQLAPGRTAPELQVPDRNGETVTLTYPGKDYYLLLFWASWCPHCHELLEKLPGIKQEMEELNLQVVTVSLDTGMTAWTAFLDKHRLPWINTCDGGGWDGNSVRSYNIYATPTMYLLDRNRKILAKPITWGELSEELKGLQPR